VGEIPSPPASGIESLLHNLIDTVIDGITYDAAKLLLGSLLVTGAVTAIVRAVFKRLEAKKELFAFSAWTFIAVATVLFLVGTRTVAPELVGAIDTIVINGAANSTDSIGVLAVGITNIGSMQSIVQKWTVAAELNGVVYEGTMLPMPPTMTLLLPDVGIEAPTKVTYYSEDNVLTKSSTPIQTGAKVSGILLVLIKGVDPPVLKTGATFYVGYADAVGKTYSVSLRMTAKSSTIGLITGIKTDLICRAPPGLLAPATSPINPPAASPPSPAPPETPAKK
jgi:hypothetical protein